MATLYGSNQDIINQLYARYRQQANQIVSENAKSIDRIIADMKKYDWWDFVSHFQAIAREVGNSIIDAYNGFKLMGDQFSNDISNLIQNTKDLDDFGHELLILGNNFVSNLFEGITAGTVGIAADVGYSVFGIDPSWAYKSEGTIPSMNRVFNLLKSEVITGGVFDKNNNKHFFDIARVVETPHQDPSHIENIENRWVTEEPDDIENLENAKIGTDLYQYKVYKEMMETVDLGISLKKDWADTLANDFFLEQTADNPGVQRFNMAVGSVSRMVPAAILSKGVGAFTSKLGVPSSVAGNMAGLVGKSYMFSSIAASSFEEAITNGASMNEAWSYSLGMAYAELLTEQIGGFKFGEKISGNVISNIFSEGFEEVIMEFADRGLKSIVTKNYEMAEESRTDILTRAAFSFIVGGFAGGFFSIPGLVKTLQSVGYKAGKLDSTIENAIKGDKTGNFQKDLAKQVKEVEKAFNNEKITLEQKLEVYEGLQFINEMFNYDEASGTFSLTEVGQKIKEGNIEAKQGNNVITKETYAVSGSDVLTQYREDVEIPSQKEGEPSQIQRMRIVKNEEIKENQNFKEGIEWARSVGLKVAVVDTLDVYKTKGSFNAFFDAQSGIIYVNKNSKTGFKSAVAHELKHALGQLYEKGQMTPSQARAYENFIEFVNEKNEDGTNKVVSLFKEVGQTFVFDETFYRKQFEGQENIEALIAEERLAAFIEQAFNNPGVLKEAFKNNKNIFQKIANIFTSELSYKKILKEMGLSKEEGQKFKTVLKQVSDLQKSFAYALNQSKENILVPRNSLKSFGLGYDIHKDLFSASVIIGETTITNMDEVFSNTKLLEDIITEYNPKAKIEFITAETNQELYEKGYFLKVNDLYYNKKDFVLEDKYIIKDIVFGDSFSLEYIEFTEEIKNNLETEFAKLKNNSTDTIFENLNWYSRKVPPHVIVGNTTIEEPIFPVFAINKHRIDAFLETNISASQSINMERFENSEISAHSWFNKEPIHDEDGNPFYVVVFPNPNIMNNEDFLVTKTDIYSAKTMVPNDNPRAIRLVVGRVDNITDEIPYNLHRLYGKYNRKTRTWESDLKIDNIDGDYKIYLEFGIEEKMKILDANIKHILNYFEETQVEDFIEPAIEIAIKNLTELTIDLRNNPKTQGEMKKEIKTAREVDPAIAIRTHNKAIESFQNLLLSDFSVREISILLNQMLNPTFRGGRTNYIYQDFWKRVYDSDFYEYDESFYKNLEDILEYKSYVEYSLSTVAESLGEVDFTKDVNAIGLLWKSDIKNTSMTRQKIVDYAEKNNIKILESFGEENFRTSTDIKKQFKDWALKSEKNVINSVFSVTDINSKTSEKIETVEVKEETKTKKPKGTRVNAFRNKDVVDFLDSVEEADTEQSYTPNTKTKLVVSTPANNAKKPPTNIFVKIQQQAKQTNKITYKTNEDVFEKNIEELLEKHQKSKRSFSKNLIKMYKNWENYIKKYHTNRKVVNHLSSTVAKTLILELNALDNLIQTDKNRTSKTPTGVELDYIVNQVNKAIFGALNYIDEKLRVAINVREENMNGFLYTRAMYWYLRDIAQNEKWDVDTIKAFNQDGRGVAYRRLINAILNYNKKGGQRELENAVRHFSNSTDVEIITDISLDNMPHTIDYVKEQWDRNTTNIKEITKIMDYKQNIFNIYDPFTTSEILGLFSKNSWSMKLMEKIQRGANRQITIARVFKAIFEKDNWTHKNSKDLKRIEKTKNAVSIKNLGGVKVTLSQVMNLRNTLMREIIRNKAIDLGLIKGQKTHHFENGNKIDILKITDIKIEKQDKKTVGKIIDQIELLNELDNIIESDSFMKEYNKMVLGFFSEMHPYVNERYIEINGLELANNGKDIKEALLKLDETMRKSFFDGLPKGINIDTIEHIYTPFLLDNSSYFKKDPVDFKDIIDLGVFDGMTQELTDSNGRISVESISTVVTKYQQEVANYYGLHRVMRDFNIVLNEKLEGRTQTSYVNGNIPKKAIKFYQELLIDMAGYKTPGRDPKLEKALSFVRRNFYKASLGANIKVLATQFATMMNLSNIYGSGITFFPKFIKNFYAQLTPENKKILKEMEGKNDFYWDRSDMSSFEIGQATKEGVMGHNWFNNMTEFLMKGIGVTDNMINKAFYLTLLETKNPDTGKNYTEEEASDTLTEGILRSQSSALNVTKASILRTDNDIAKIFLKFMGEPLKLITQVASSKKNLELIRKLKENIDTIEEKQNEKIEIEENVLETLKQELKTKEAKESAKGFNDLSTREQKAIRKEVKDAEKAIKKQEQKVDTAKENKKEVLSQIQEVIDNEPKVKRLARGRIVSVLTTMTYLSMLAVAFDLARTKGGEKDDEDYESVSQMLMAKFGQNFIDEIFGMMPYIRDAYQLVAKGYDLDNFDEIGAMNDFFKSFYYVSQAIVNGKEINWGKQIRYGLGATAEMFGLPVRGLERLFTTPLIYVDEKAWYEYQNLIGKQNRDNIELTQAIASGDIRMVQAIVEHKLETRRLKVSNLVMDELVYLASKGYEVKMTGINETITVDGVEYTLTKKQKDDFAKIYSDADFVIQKIIKTPRYKRLNDDMKQTLIQAIYNYYYRKAKQDVLKVDLIPEATYFRTLSQAYNYFIERAISYFEKQRSREYLLEQRKKATA